MKSIYIQLKDHQKIYVEYKLHQSSTTAIIYVHGGPGEGCWTFKYAAEKLSKKYSVISYDQRGVLRSDPITDYFCSELLIDDIEEIRKHFGFDKIILIGHSYGGQLILRYATKYPKHISNLIYVCPSLNFELSLKSIYQKSYQLLKNQNNDYKIKELKATVSDGTVASYLKHLYDIPESIRREVYYLQGAPEMVNEINENIIATEEDWDKGIKQQQKIFEEPEMYQDYLPLLKEVKIPTLLIVGDHDPICCETHRKCFFDNENTKIEVIANAGHSLCSENSEEFIAIVDNYVNAF